MGNVGRDGRDGKYTAEISLNPSPQTLGAELIKPLAHVGLRTEYPGELQTPQFSVGEGKE